MTGNVVDFTFGPIHLAFVGECLACKTLYRYDQADGEGVECSPCRCGQCVEQPRNPAFRARNLLADRLRRFARR